MNRLALSVCCVAVLAACDKKADAKPAVAPVVNDKPAVAAPKGTGINDPANDPKVVELAKKALACKWENNRVDSECADYKAWEADADVTKAFGTLAAFMEDSDANVRSLPLQRLRDLSSPFTDKATAERLVAVAEKTKSANEVNPLGNFIGHIQLADTGLFPRIKALVTSSTGNTQMTGPIVMYLLKTNPESEEAFNLIRDTIKDKESKVSRDALGGLSMAGNEKLNEARCDIFLESIESPDDGLAGDAAQNLGAPRNGCQTRYDALLKSIDARVTAKTAGSLFVDSLRQLCLDKGGTPAQKKTANALAHKVADDKTLDGHVRTTAIDASVECDLKGAKAYLGKFKKDKDPEVKETVARIEKYKLKKK